MHVRVGLWRKLSTKELMLLNCVVGEAPESPLDCREIHPKGNQFWMLIGRTDAAAETRIFWPPDVKSWLIWKDPDAGKDGRQEEKETTEEQMVGWYHWLDGHEFQQALEVGDRQGGLVWCSPWGHKGSDKTELIRSQSPHMHNKDESQYYYAELKKEARPKIMHIKCNLQEALGQGQREGGLQRPNFGRW